MTYHVVVLAGGSGTRLWPLSRRDVPKHLLPLHPSGATLLGATIERVKPLSAPIHIVTALSQVPACVIALKNDGIDPDTIDFIAEPSAMGTGPALGLAMARIIADDPHAVISSIHADGHIDDAEAYRNALVNAASYAAPEGEFATVGIRPTSPSTGFGYIERGKAVELPGSTRDSSIAYSHFTALPAYAAVRFVEKPDAARAEAFVGSGLYLWNSGLFAWRASTFLAALEGADARISRVVREVADLQRQGEDEEAARRYATLVPVAVDPLIMEKTTSLTVVEASFGWSDLGSWSDLGGIWRSSGRGDAQGNIVSGNGLVLEGRDVLIHSSTDRLVAVLGLSDIVVIDEPGALLVLSSDQAQKVKDIVDALSQARREDVL